MPTPVPSGHPTQGARQLISRQLRLDDIPALLQLESKQWDANQAATDEALRSRLLTHPDLCVGTFCMAKGEALSSLFMRPIQRESVLRARSWSDCTSGPGDTSTGSSHSLFGISMTSVDPEALRCMEAFIWPKALSSGWQEIYLGSPMPGLRHAIGLDPTLSVNDYAHARRRGLPRDVQLRYYHQKGLTDIVAVLPGYFPYEEALDYGVMLRGSLHDIAARTCNATEPAEVNAEGRACT